MPQLRQSGMLSIEQLLHFPKPEALTKQERWNLIGEIDDQVDHLINVRNLMRQNKMLVQSTTDTISQLLEKKRTIWLTIQPHAGEIIRACNLPARATA